MTINFVKLGQLGKGTMVLIIISKKVFDKFAKKDTLRREQKNIIFKGQ